MSDEAQKPRPSGRGAVTEKMPDHDPLALIGFALIAEREGDGDTARVMRAAAVEIDRLRGALRIVDQDARDHIRSDEIAPALLRPHALRAVRVALGAE